jgi:colanic acid/amylovoran biosynthesis protein
VEHVNEARSKVKIVITNTVALNGGDAAILTAAIHLLSEAFGPDSEIVVVDDQSWVARRYYPHLRFEQNLHVSRFVPRLSELAAHALRTADRQDRRQRAVLSGGARALLEAVRPLRFSEAKAMLVRAVARGRRWLSPLLPRQSQATLEAYYTADLVVSTGGTYLVEHYDLSRRLLEFDVARALGIPLIFFTQSLGPFSKPRVRRRLKQHLESSPLVLVRDERSRLHLHEIGVSGDNVRLHSDCVFALGKPEGARRLRQRSLPSSNDAKGGPLVYVSVRSWSGFSQSADEGMRRYRRAIAVAVTQLVQSQGARVEFLSTCQGIPEYWRDDAKTALQIHAQLSPEVRARVRVDAAFHTPDQLMSRFAAADYVIATRMHAAILSLLSGTVVLAIAYEFKTLELFDRLGCGDFCVSMDNVSDESLLNVIETFTRGIDARRDTLAERVEREMASARAVVPLLRRVLARTD